LVVKEPERGCSPTPAISVIVVTHESAGVIAACLNSLRRHPPERSHEVIVVDNASTDRTASIIEEDYPEVRLVRSDRRRGFAANCNTGARLARGAILFLLNPDARITPGSVDALADYLDAHPSVAVVGPSLVYPDGSHQPSARRFPTTAVTLLRRSPLRLLWPNSEGEQRHLMLDVAFDQPAEVDWLLGAALSLRASVYGDLGGMDERYRLYCEDIDLCRRAWEAGGTVVLLPEAVVEHDLSELTRRRFLTRATLWHMRSMARYVRLHGVRRPTVGALRPNSDAHGAVTTLRSAPSSGSSGRRG
jgi:N-acetylglucosaminyl-diphospho-decaprenol L-rhamnosyltransferase